MRKETCTECAHPNSPDDALCAVLCAYQNYLQGQSGDEDETALLEFVPKLITPKLAHSMNQPLPNNCSYKEQGFENRMQVLLYLQGVLSHPNHEPR